MGLEDNNDLFCHLLAQMIGQAIGGVFPALVDIFIVAIQVKEEDVGAACFTIATVVLLVCLFSLRWSMRTDFFKYYYYHQQDDTQTAKPPIIDVIRRCWVYFISIFLTFTITLTIFPSVAVLVQSETYNSNSKWAIGNVQLVVNLIFILYARWHFKIVCLQTKLALLAIRKKSNLYRFLTPIFNKCCPLCLQKSSFYGF